jgi:hypothetical protein
MTTRSRAPGSSAKSARNAARAVALDGAADLARRGDAEPQRLPRLTALEHEHQPIAAHADAALLDAQEFSALSDTVFAAGPTSTRTGRGHYFW